MAAKKTLVNPRETGNGVTLAAAPTATENTVMIGPVVPKIVELEIVGITPLLVCAWSEKAKRQILEKHMKKAGRGKEAKDPQQCYKDSLYVSTEGWTGIPAGGFKGCLVNACRATDDVPMTIAKRMLFVIPQGTRKVSDIVSEFTGQKLELAGVGQELIRIHGDHFMHESIVRIDNGGSVDYRFRAIYPEWSAKIQISFLSNMISAEQVANLVELAGFCEGLCEHRPGAPKSHTGSFGRFQIRR